jgi:hypothetical protein
MTENSDENPCTNEDYTSFVKEHFYAVDITKNAIESANVGIWIIDTATKNFRPSNRTKELFGYLPRLKHFDQYKTHWYSTDQFAGGIEELPKEVRTIAPLAGTVIVKPFCILAIFMLV